MLAATASGGPAGLAEDVVTELLAQARIPAVTGTLGSQTLALLPAGEWTPAAADLVRAGLAGLAPGLGTTRLVLGISSPAPLTRLRGAVEEASHARLLGGQRAQQICLVSGEEIGLHQFLLSALPEDLRAALRRRVLGPALDYDAQHHSDLVGTLRMFLDCDASWTVTAAKLHVHVNTLRYRLRRLEELLHVNLSDFRQRVDLFLALFAETPS